MRIALWSDAAVSLCISSRDRIFPSSLGQPSMRTPPRILIVDDNPTNVKVLQTRLVAEGYEVVTAADGEEGLATARQQTPDLILLDVMMPKLDGVGRLRRFFSPQLAELIVSGGADDPLKSHRREITVVYLDLRGFTAFAEVAEPEEVMGVLREYHQATGKLVLEYEGTLEHFTGDGMTILFNDPLPIANPSERAVRMALAIRERVGQMSDDWVKRGYELSLGIGIAQGYATIGAIGFEGRWDYSAIGTVTNLASRLCGEAPGDQILIAH